MDVIKKNVEKSYFYNIKFRVGLGVAGLLFLLFYISHSSRTSVDRDKLIFGVVKVGDLNVEVEGFGELKSDRQRLITSLSDATVKEIIIKPGAAVVPDSLILRLENPILQQDLESAKQKLMQIEAEYRQLKVNLLREAIAEESEVANLDSELVLAKIHFDAQTAVFGKGAVSKLDYERSKALLEQLTRSLAFKKNSQAQLKLVHKESLLIHEEKINQQKGELAIIQGRINSLSVVAGIDGVLQRLPVELGQSVKAGQELALVAGTEELIAILNVPQTQAGLLSVGMHAKIDNRTEKIDGIVERIDPSVTKNTVAVEVRLKGSFSNARVGQNVDGAIIVDTLAATAYMERPVGVVENSSKILYRLDNSGTTGVRSDVKFGKSAGRFIQVSSHVEAGEKYIISDLESVTGRELKIKN